MHHPMHRKDREEDRSSSYRQPDHQDKKGREIESHLEDQRPILVVYEDGSHPKEQVERQQSQCDINRFYTEVGHDPKESRHDNDPRRIEGVSLQQGFAFDLDRLCRSIVPEKHPEKDQRNEREIS